MSEASPHLHHRADAARRHPADRRHPAGDPFSLDAPYYPLDPPLVDVRIPVRAPHATATAYSRAGLRHHFPEAEVGDDLHMLFSEPGKQLQSRLSPDVFVALAVPRRGTRSDYDADLLGPPDFILEVVSRSTWKHDLGRKLDCYQRLGVRECLFFDATRADRDGTGEELWGFALTPTRREPLAETALPNGERGVVCAVLGLVAHVARRTPPSAPGDTWELTMRWHDPATGEDIPDYHETRAAAVAERARADAERSRADAAKHETRAERARADEAEREATAQRGRADAERDRADAAEHETQAAQRETQAAQRRVAELEEQLRRRRDKP